MYLTEKGVEATLSQRRKEYSDSMWQ